MRVFTFTLSIILSVFLLLSCGTESTPVYNLTTSVVGDGFNIRLSFDRVVVFSAGDVIYQTVASTYVRGITGTHSRDSENIISALDNLLDLFLSDYLDAND